MVAENADKTGSLESVVIFSPIGRFETVPVGGV